ncbi:MAG: AMP-binding protein [Clostridia bacterium]|nr:AMP-binding protein [Clostridia bacterium]
MKSVVKKDVTDFKDIKGVIYNSAKKFANNVAFRIKEKVGKETKYKDVTYAQMLKDVNNFGTGLYNKGLKGKRVAIIGKNRYEWALTYVTNLLGGIIAVPLDKELQYNELENSLIRSKAEAIVFDPKLKDSILEIKKNGKTSLKHFICMDKNVEDFESVEEIMNTGKVLLEKGNKEYVDADPNENEMGILLFTSGTTSQSKAVMLTSRNIAANIYAMLCVEDIRETDTNIAFLPFHHIFGSTCMLVMLACGVKTVFPDGLKYIKQNLKEYKVTIFVGVPALVEAMYKALTKEVEKQGKTKLIKVATKVSDALLKCKIDVRRKLFKQVIDGLGGELRMIIEGGAAADPVISKAFNSLGILVLQGYGLTETAPVIVAENPNERRLGSVGKPMLNDTVEIANPDTNGVGDIRVKGPNVMLGYYEMPEQTEEVLRDGYFYTGDLGYFDKDGYLFITGRSKNMIVLKNGKKVFPEELESLVNRLDLVEESMVFGLPDDEDKNDIKLSVKVVYNEDTVKEKHGDISEQEIYDMIWDQIKELNKTFPNYKHIKNVILSKEELIKNSSKKVKRFEEMKLILGENK